MGSRAIPTVLLLMGKLAMTPDRTPAPDSHNYRESSPESPSVRVDSSPGVTDQDDALSIDTARLTAQLSQLSSDSHELSDSSSLTLSHSHHPVRGERVREERESEESCDDEHQSTIQ